MTHFRTRHLKCVIMTQCVVTTRQKCVMRHENELRQNRLKAIAVMSAGIALTLFKSKSLDLR